jgi:3-hydroxyisobutyrate dehydrogenase/2-hydroxy-3-oxopropionate reductase
MGSRIAQRLSQQGHDVTVWNRTPGRAPTEGVTEAETIAEAVRGAAVVITMVRDDTAIDDLRAGPGGLATSVQPGTVVVQMSTISPAALERLRAALPDGVDLVDAPVLGSGAEAGAGSLTILAGGDPSVLQRCAPVLEALGTVKHVGPVGAGTAAKLVANSALFGVLAVLGESLALARGLGLDAGTAFDVLGTTALAAQAERRRPAIERDEYPPRFLLSLARKDADLAQDAARTAHVAIPALAAARSWLAEAEAAGWGALDYTALLRTILTSRDATSHPEPGT